MYDILGMDTHFFSSLSKRLPPLGTLASTNRARAPHGPARKLTDRIQLFTFG